MHVIERFYSAFAARNAAAMAACYADGARFSDPVFTQLDARQVRAMWAMLLERGKDLSITYRVERADAHTAVCIWHAHYTFSTTGRKVHHIVRSEFELKDDLIALQKDDFDFWRWSRQALGIKGLLLGWSPVVRNKVRATAAASLARYMA